MRYLLHKSQSHELDGRKDYLYDIFRLYFIPDETEDNYLSLHTVGKSDLDYLFITGHIYHVKAYLTKRIREIPENTIVITSCIGREFRVFASMKEIYVPNTDGQLCEIRDGQPYGFKFNISDAELDFYNAKGTILDRLNSAYVRLR
jgi:hypothetical protein